MNPNIIVFFFNSYNSINVDYLHNSYAPLKQIYLSSLFRRAAVLQNLGAEQTKNFSIFISHF